MPSWTTYVRKIERTSQFKRDYRREAKGQHRMSLDAALVPILVAWLMTSPWNLGATTMH